MASVSRLSGAVLLENFMSRKVEQRLDAVYATLPEMECKGLCQESCGPIGMTPAEWRRLKDLTGIEPTVDESLTCSMLKEGKCAGYEARPAICRLWGVEESMPCEFGCKPARYLNREEGYHFLDRVDKAAGRKGSLLTLK